MKDDIVQKLNKLNKDFYKKVSESFDSKRPTVWTGWDEFINYIKKQNLNPNFVLDIACGNGRFAPLINKNFPNAKYIGIDSNLPLVNKAKERYQSQNTDFIHMDIKKYLDLPNETKFDLITLIAFIHHVPGKENRINLLKNISKLLSKDGLIIITFWRFIENEKLSQKTLDWKNINIDPSDVEKNDYLLGWDKQEGVYRYCHYADDEETDELTKKAGLKIVHSYTYEGKSGKLSKTIICRKK